MRHMGDVYKPGEDSFLLAKWVKKLVSGHVLDMGTGSGFQAVTAAEKPEVCHVTAVDINPKAVEVTKKRVEAAGLGYKIRVSESNLFDNVSGRFRWIIFNPPYLASEWANMGVDEASWVGGVRGSELIRSFLNKSKVHLSENGSILLIYSSKTGLKADDFKQYEINILEKKQVFFEALFCVMLKLNPS